ncbi:1-phosphatidylinositol phosphodiesterase [Ceratocystis lukuohia]|uniref:1-phosphatidylinositol phosphodiesterase n=1 Tax=Ceratocystis lukuohia TaxID=2019550 RepID=A0ABR4MA52_9PEZI
MPTTIPTLGQARGKVLILQDFKTAARYGIPWNSKTVSSYSNQLAAGRILLPWYWSRVQAHISRSPPKIFDKLRITHTSVSFGVKPINMAAENNGDPGMNRHLGEYLLFEKGDSCGIVAMDFPNDGLVQAIVKLNYQHLVPTFVTGGYGYELPS